MKCVNYELDVLVTKHGRRAAESVKKRKNIEQNIENREKGIGNVPVQEIKKDSIDDSKL